MQIKDYLERIDYTGPVEPTCECLCGIHKQHLLKIPYENLDVHLERPLDLNSQHIFEKIVERHRGGWCYEMNGLLSWALETIGFKVTRVQAGMSRSLMGDVTMGNHLVLRVDFDEQMIADTGIGDGILEPLRLVEGEQIQSDRTYQLERLEHGFWRFHNHPGHVPSDFDFLPAHPADEQLLERTCRRLQADANSIFRKNLICMQPEISQGMKVLIGRVLMLPGREKILINNADQFCEVLDTVFGLRDPAFILLWPIVVTQRSGKFAE